MHFDDAVPTTNNPLHYREGQQDTITAVQTITYVRNSCPLTYDDR